MNLFGASTRSHDTPETRLSRPWVLERAICTHACIISCYSVTRISCCTTSDRHYHPRSTLFSSLNAIKTTKFVRSISANTGFSLNEFSLTTAIKRKYIHIAYLHMYVPAQSTSFLIHLLHVYESVPRRTNTISIFYNTSCPQVRVRKARVKYIVVP